MNNIPESPLEKEQISVFQIGMLILSAYVIVALIAQTFFILSDQLNRLLDSLDFIVCLVFIADVGYRFYKAKNKLYFMKWSWIDLVSSIPVIDFLRWGRFIRIVRILRILRAFRSTKMLISFLFKNRAQGAFISTVLISVLLLIFASIAVLTFETDPNSNIKSPTDAIWWGFSTITTVGYGDRYPVTLEGKIVAVILMIAGVGLFGTFTAYVASLFIEPGQKKEERETDELRKEVALLRKKLDSIAKKLTV